jgi:hypothetical protein
MLRVRACCPLWRPQAVILNGRRRRAIESNRQVPVAYEPAEIHPLASCCRRYGGTLIESGAEVSAAFLEPGQSHLP